VVIVLWRILLGNVSALVAQNGHNGLPNGFPEDGDAAGRKRTNPNSSAHLDALVNGQLADSEDGTDPVVEELNGIRSREITSKAVAGTLLTLLKWFKLSRSLLQYRVRLSISLLTWSRHSKIRVPHPASVGRKLLTTRPQISRSSGR